MRPPCVSSGASADRLRFSFSLPAPPKARGNPLEPRPEGEISERGAPGSEAPHRHWHRVNRRGGAFLLPCGERLPLRDREPLRERSRSRSLRRSRLARLSSSMVPSGPRGTLAIGQQRILLGVLQPALAGALTLTTDDELLPQGLSRSHHCHCLWVSSMAIRRLQRERPQHPP